MRASKPTVILVFVRFYLPGYKTGGPARTIANIVETLGDEFEFWIVTSDRDAGDLEPYPHVPLGTWNRVGKARVFYVPTSDLKLSFLYRLIKNTRHDAIYLNSFFDDRFSIPVAFARRFLSVSRSQVILAPRGEFSTGALQLKRWKKYSFILFSRWISLHKNSIWQASSEYEARDLRRSLGNAASRIAVAPNLPKRAEPTNEKEHNILRNLHDPLRVIYLSRITAKKNLDYALRVLTRVDAPIIFDVYGPVDDLVYWEKCQHLAKQLPSHIRMTYHGSVRPEDVHAIFSRYDLHFLPTRGENYGHAIAESLTAGTPVLLSDQTPWLNLSGRGLGWEFPLDDSDKFVTHLQKLALSERIESILPSRNEVSEQAYRVLRSSSALKRNRKLFSFRPSMNIY